jgi:hypothetical protein
VLHSVLSCAEVDFKRKVIHLMEYIFYLVSLLLCDKIKKNEMDGACGAYGGGERRVQGFGGET